MSRPRRQPKRAPRRRKRVDWAEAPVVYVTRARCYFCGERDYTCVRSAANGDGSNTIKAICKACGGEFKITEEPE